MHSLCHSFFYQKEGFNIEEITHEQYVEALRIKENLKQDLLDIKIQKSLNKINNEVLTKLLKKEEIIRSKYAKNAFIITSYEMEQEKERGEKDDKHKGK